MNNDAQHFLDQMAALPPGTFHHRFAKISDKLSLASLLDRNELKLLFEACLRAQLCNVAINGIGTVNGAIRPEDEPRRVHLEHHFMEARDLLYASPGWQNLADLQKQRIQNSLLEVFVRVSSLAR